MPKGPTETLEIDLTGDDEGEGGSKDVVSGVSSSHYESSSYDVDADP